MPFAGYADGYAQSILRLSSIATRVTFSAETSEGARLLTKETGLTVVLCPHIVDECLFQLTDREVASKPLLVGWLGYPRVEKGAAILPQIIRAVTTLAKSDQLKFLIQCAGRNSRKSRQFESQLTEFGDSVEQLPAAISQDGYLAAFNRCDVILLPYDPKSYPPERGSAIAIEALLTGKPMVAMDQTFAAGLIEPNSGAVGTDAETLAAGLLAIANDYEYFRSGALRTRDRARKTYDRLTSYGQLIGLTSDMATQ
jgi:glycosyltransferase involved in cell wall biosynthesis